jgi:hypothetical protein
MSALGHRLRRDGLTLLLALGIVYVFVTSTVPALRDRQQVRERRVALEREIEALVPLEEQLRAWNEGALDDPLLRERLLERWRRSPDAPGYRVIHEDPVVAEGEAGGR